MTGDRARSSQDRLPGVPERLHGVPVELVTGRLAERFDWPVAADALEVVSWWGSRTARFLRCRARDGSVDVALKVGRGWEPGVAEMRYRRMERLARALSGATEAAGVPELLGWLPDPQVIAMAYVDGEEMPVRLGSELTPRWEEWGRLCGRTLGFIHRSEVADPGDREAMAVARAELERAAGRILIPRRRWGDLADLVVPVRPYSDFMPVNFRVSVDGRLYLIDPPAEETWSTAHRDMAWFRAEMGPDFDPRRRRLGMAELRRRKHLLWESFLQGYAETGLFDPRPEGHRRLIELLRVYRTGLQTRDLVRTGRYGQAARQGVRALMRRLRLATRTNGSTG